MKKFFVFNFLFLPLLGYSTTINHYPSEEEGYSYKREEKVWSLEECMAYSAEHAPAVAKARWDLATAEVSKTEAIAEFFPSISAQVGGQFNWGRNIDPETNTYNNVATFNNGYGVYLSMTLFDGGRTFNNFRLARAERERSLNNVRMQCDDRAITTMMAYVDALYYKGAVEIAGDKLKQSEGMLKLTKLQEELGTKSYPDVVQAEAELKGDEYTLVQQQNLYLQSMLKLRSTMNLPDEVELILDSVKAENNPPFISNGTGEIIAEALHSNPEAFDAEMGVKEHRIRLLVEKGRLFPDIRLNTGISTSYFKNLTGGFSAVGFGDQFRNNRGEYLSVSLSFPIFSNLNIISSVKRARNELQRSIVEKEERLRKLQDNIILAVADRNGYIQEIISMEAKTEADRKAYELNGRKYEEGLLSWIDLRLSANNYYSSRLGLLQKRMLLILKNKIIEYYKGDQSWMSR